MPVTLKHDELYPSKVFLWVSALPMHLMSLWSSTFILAKYHIISTLVLMTGLPVCYPLELMKLLSPPDGPTFFPLHARNICWMSLTPSLYLMTGPPWNMPMINNNIVLTVFLQCNQVVSLQRETESTALQHSMSTPLTSTPLSSMLPDGLSPVPLVVGKDD